MNKLSLAGIAVLSILAIDSSTAQTPLTPAQLEANKRVAMEFYRPGITVEERIALIHKDYIQHNATYVKYAKDHNVSAHEAFSQIRRQQAIDQAAGRGGPAPGAAPAGAPQGNTFHILYAEGDLVVRIAQRWNQVPGVPGRFYETFFWDTFQVRDGKLYQHWDAAVIAPPAGAAPAAPAVPGAAPATTQAPEASQASMFGVPALATAPPPQAWPPPPAGDPLVRVIGACDVVTIIHSVYTQDPTLSAGNFYEHFTYDTFRVRNGKLVEHWDGAALPPVARGSN